MPRFQVIPTRHGGYAWRFLSANNRILISSADTFTERSACERAITKVRTLTPQIRKISVGAYTWRLSGTITSIDILRNIANAARVFCDNAPHAPVHFIHHLQRPR